jgi:hypothetical protein
MDQIEAVSSFMARRHEPASVNVFCRIAEVHGLRVGEPPIVEHCCTLALINARIIEHDPTDIWILMLLTFNEVFSRVGVDLTRSLAES